jgi:hypothetical protein
LFKRLRLFIILAGSVLTGALTIAAITQFGAVEVMARHN